MLFICTVQRAAAMSSEHDYSAAFNNWSLDNFTINNSHNEPDSDSSELAGRLLMLDVVQTVAFKLVVPPIVAFGCVGNIISIVVLTRKSMKSSTNRYLTCLAVYDILYLVFAFSMILKHYQHIGRSASAAVFLCCHIALCRMTDTRGTVARVLMSAA